MIVVWLLLAGCTAALREKSPEPESETPPVKIDLIAPGVWLHTSYRALSNGVVFPANGLIVRHDEGLLLIDTAWGEQPTRELLVLIDQELAVPVTHAIVTHFHEDSAGGVSALAEHGIRSYAHPLTVSLLDSAAPVFALNDFHQRSATVSANVEVFYPGHAHSADNVAVYVPHAKVLFGTCAVRTPQFRGRGNVADADIAHWPVAMKALQSRYPDVRLVVPGHGSPGTASLLQHTIDLFTLDSSSVSDGPVQ